MLTHYPFEPERWHWSSRTNAWLMPNPCDGPLLFARATTWSAFLRDNARSWSSRGHTLDRCLVKGPGRLTRRAAYRVLLRFVPRRNCPIKRVFTGEYFVDY